MSSPPSEVTAYRLVAEDSFSRDAPVSDVGLESPQIWESFTGAAAIVFGVLAPATAPPVLVRYLEEKPVPAVGVGSLGMSQGMSDLFRSYRVWAHIPYSSLLVGAIDIITQFEDASNYVAMRVSQASNLIIPRLVQGGTPTADLDGSGAFASHSFSKWTDPTLVAIEYLWDTNRIRVFVNGLWIEFSRGGNDFFSVPLVSAAQNWARKGGVGFNFSNSHISHWGMDSRHGAVPTPSIKNVQTAISSSYGVFLAEKMIPNLAYGFPAHDSDRTLASVQWEITVGGSPFLSTTTNAPSARALIAGPLEVGTTYSVRYRFVDDLGQFSSWSEVVDEEVEGEPVSPVVRLLAKPDSLTVFPMDPIPEVTFEETQEWEVSRTEFEDRREQRQGFIDTPPRTFILRYRSILAEKSDVLWDYYEARKGRRESFVFVIPSIAARLGAISDRNMAVVVRFESDQLSRENFESDLFSKGIRLLEILS